MTHLALGNPTRTSAIDHPMFLAGAWLHRIDVSTVRDPESGEVIATVPLAGEEDAAKAVEAAFALRDTARAMPTHQRCAILNEAAAIVESEAEDYSRIIAREGIKTIREARREVERCVMTLRLSAAEATRLTGETINFGLRPEHQDRMGFHIPIPVGVIVAITPFNDPLNLVAHKLGPAIAAGNCVILKPHQQTPLSALRLAGAFERAGLPPGVLQVITGRGRVIGKALVSDPRVRMVSFTGGVETGRQIAAAAGLKKLGMELGSNCPTIVMADADLDAALSASISGAYWAAGQNCLHVQRLYIQRVAYARFRDEFVAASRAYRLGAKLSEETDMGCLVDEASALRIEGALRGAVAAGARLLCGGRRDATRFTPTAIEGVPHTHNLAQQEIYGPVTILAPFDTFDEAVSFANATDYGLQAAIFTRDVDMAWRAFDRLEAGAVIVNDSTDFRVDSMPFGGIKSSGLGREGVRSAVLEMTETKVACFRLSGR